MVQEAARLTIERDDGLHVFGAKLEVDHGEVLRHALLADGLRGDHLSSTIPHARSGTDFSKVTERRVDTWCSSHRCALVAARVHRCQLPGPPSSSTDLVRARFAGQMRFMALQARRHFTLWLKHRLGPNRGHAAQVAAVGVTVLQYALARARQPGADELLSDESARWLAEVRRAGYCVVPGFMSPEDCRLAIEEIERLFAKYPSYVQRKSDLRMFGVECASPLLRTFAEDPRLLGVAAHMLREPTVNAFTLGARIDYSAGNKGSGEGWHRDSFVVQFKSLLYLSDVALENGPLQLIADSEKLPRLAADIVGARLGLAQQRVPDEYAERLIAAHPERLRTFTAPAGTLLLVNTSAIHRGRPVEGGSRYALTNYFVQRARAGAKMDAHFAPVLRAP